MANRGGSCALAAQGDARWIGNISDEVVTCGEVATDTLFFEEASVKLAVVYIRARAAENIYVGDVVLASGISRNGW